MRYNQGDFWEGAAVGLVYFVRAQALKLIKIGSTSDLSARLSVMRAQSPDRLSVVGTIEARDPLRLEKSLHGRFAELRSHGEWLHPGPALLTFIRDHAALPDDAHPNSVALQEVYGDALADRYAASISEGAL